jgi:hypothetical protein
VLDPFPSNVGQDPLVAQDKRPESGLIDWQLNHPFKNFVVLLLSFSGIEASYRVTEEFWIHRRPKSLRSNGLQFLVRSTANEQGEQLAMRLQCRGCPARLRPLPPVGADVTQVV